MTEATTPSNPNDAMLVEILQDLRQRLAKIENIIEPPTRAEGGHPFRAPGKQVSAVEYERRTGIPRVAAALALSLLQYTQAETAKRIGVNRRTLQVGLEFEPYRQSIISVRQQSGLARQDDED